MGRPVAELVLTDDERDTLQRVGAAGVVGAGVGEAVSHRVGLCGRQIQ
jgi:hypothetical protein